MNLAKKCKKHKVDTFVEIYKADNSIRARRTDYSTVWVCSYWNRPYPGKLVENTLRGFEYIILD